MSDFNKLGGSLYSFANPSFETMSYPVPENSLFSQRHVAPFYGSVFLPNQPVAYYALRPLSNFVIRSHMPLMPPQ